LVNYQLDRTFAALADPTRREIVALLARRACTAGELAEPFDISLPAVSRHLRVLEEAGLLRREIDGRIHRCSLDPKPIAAAAEWIESMRDFWQSQFNALAAYLQRVQEEETWPSPKPKRSSSGKPSPRRGRKSSAPGPTRKR
jgi:DNA-binding transcriptional ArsR family regulator